MFAMGRTGTGPSRAGGDARSIRAQLSRVPMTLGQVLAKRRG